MRGNEVVGVERVAAAPSEYVVDEGRCGRPADERGDLLFDLPTTEPLQRDPTDVWKPDQLGEMSTLRGVDPEIVGSIRTDHDDRLLIDHADEELEQRPRLRVGPVEVLEGDDRSGPVRDNGEVEHRLEQLPGIGGRRRLRRRRHPLEQRSERIEPSLRQPAPHAADQIGQGRQRNGLASLRCASGHEELDPGSPARFRDEPRLADAGLSTHEHAGRHAVPCLVHRRAEGREGRCAADELARPSPVRHRCPR